jgi:hypothetical protein
MAEGNESDQLRPHSLRFTFHVSRFTPLPLVPRVLRGPRPDNSELTTQNNFLHLARPACLAICLC